MADLILAEDNADLAFGLKANLAIEGHQVRICADGADVLPEIRKRAPELLILDVMLPNRDGFSLLDDIRKSGFEFPILMLTARSEESEMVFALRRGADDYVTKPFGLMELIARIEALLRRSLPAQQSDPDTWSAQGVEVHRPSRQVRVDGQQVNLTPREYDLLLALIDAPNEVHSRQNLLRQVWGHRSDVASRTVDTHIAELRRKLEKDPAHPRFLLTARSVGYWVRCPQARK